MVNVVFIIAWYVSKPRTSTSTKSLNPRSRSRSRYCFSTLISVYSTLRSHAREARALMLTLSSTSKTDKWMFAEDHFNFPYPLFVTSIHMLVQWILAALVMTVFPRLRPSTRPQANDYV